MRTLAVLLLLAGGVIAQEPTLIPEPPPTRQEFDALASQVKALAVQVEEFRVWRDREFARLRLRIAEARRRQFDVHDRIEAEKGRRGLQ